MNCSNTKGDHLVIVLAMRTMDEKTLAEWQKELGKTRDIPTLEKLDEFLQTQIFTREALSPTPPTGRKGILRVYPHSQLF